MRFLRPQVVGTRGPRQTGRASIRFAFLLILLPAFSATAAPTLERLRDTGVLRLGYLAAVPPFSFHDESGEPAGFAVDLCASVTNGLRQRLAMPALRSEFVAVPPQARFDAVQDGTVDLLCAGGTPTLSLRQRVSFSIPVFPGGIGALLHRDATDRLQAAVAGEPPAANPRWGTSLGQVMQKRVFVAVPGSRAAAWLADGIREFGLDSTIKPVDSIDEGVALVAERQADAMFAEREVLLHAVQHDAAAKDLAVVSRKFTFEPMAFALSRDDDDFRVMLDAELSRLYRSGEWMEIYTRAFGAPDEETRRYYLDTALPE